MASFYRNQLERFLSELEINTDSLLDIGGSDLPITTRLKSCQTKRYVIIDTEKPQDENIEFYQVDLNYYRSAEDI